MLVKFHNGEMQVSLHDKDGERVVALLGPTSGKDRKPFMSETLTTWRADLIEYFLRIAPPELTVRTVFVVPEFLGIIEGAEERTFGDNPDGIEEWKNELFTQANVLALFLGYNRTTAPGDNGRFEAGYIAGRFPKKSLVVIPSTAEGGKAQTRFRFRDQMVGNTIEHLAKAIVDKLN